ncbi:MAG: glycosyltransferase [Candidatus Methanomethylicaceae archaeon]
MRTPLVSVNMCVWKPHPRHFKAAVESVLQQTLSHFEFVIVEDPSEVDGAALISSYLHDSRIHYVQNRVRTGLVNQRNQAISLSRGKFIAFLDADDSADPRRLERQVAFLEQHPEISFLGSDILIMDENDQIFAYRAYPNSPTRVAKLMRLYCALAFPAVTCLRAAVVSLGGFKGDSYVTDYDLWCRAARQGYLIDNVPEPLTCYRVYRNARTRARAKRVLWQTIRTKLRYFGFRMSPVAYSRLVCEVALLALPTCLLNELFRILTLKELPTTLAGYRKQRIK